MEKDKLQFKVQSLRTLASPYSRDDRGENPLETIYYLLVDMRELPEGIPLDVNPRKPKMNTNVGKSLEEAVREPEIDFYINNRGIVISAKSLAFDTTKSMVTIDIGDQSNEYDRDLYGILDGGHTYTAIIRNRDKIPDDLTKYVRIEVITNVQNITRLSDARNTSMQVSDIALFNLDEKFEDVRAAIQDESYADSIAYKDNDNKPIHVSALLRLLYAFDIERYPDDVAAPVQSFSGKAQVFKRYSAAYNTDFYKALTKQLPKLTELYDRIELEMADKYAEYKKMQGEKPKFGLVGGVEKAKNSAYTTFYSIPMKYQISTGYIYPIFGAFRSLLKYDQDTKAVEWLFDPIEVWNEVGTSLVQNTFETSRNPQLAGKDKQLWLANYRIVETQSLRKLLQRHR